jgi:hypothetical protein
MQYLLSTCSNRICASSFLGICLDWECAEYKVDSPNCNGTEIHSSKIPEYWGVLSNLFSGLYGGSLRGYLWNAGDDIVCSSATLTAIVSGPPPPCDLKAQVVAHCMLNKDDNVGPDRDCMHACDQGDWNGDCGGDDNVQRYAFWDVRNLALTSTVHYLFVFCKEATNLCF